MARRRLPRMLTDGELAALLRASNVRTPTGLRNKGMLKVMSYGGLRVSEAVTLKTSDVRREDGGMRLEVRDGKGGRDRTVPLPDHAAETLELWLERRGRLRIGNGYVFCTISRGHHVHPVRGAEGFTSDTTTKALKPGEPLNPRYVQQLVGRLASKAGIEGRVTPHTLRHTAATRMLKAGRNLREVQELLGHANVSTTQIYTHVLAEDLADAVDAVPDVEAEDDEGHEPATIVLPPGPTHSRAADAELHDLASRLADLSPEERRELARLVGGADE